MKQLLILTLAFFAMRTEAQDSASVAGRLSVSDGVIVIKPAATCGSCKTDIATFRKTVEGLSLNKRDTLWLKNSFSLVVGKTLCCLTHYNFHFGKDTLVQMVIHLEDDSLIIQDVGADGVRTDFVKEYCVTKADKKPYDWDKGYSKLMSQASCQASCFLNDLVAAGYKGIGYVETNGKRNYYLSR
ncbi:MAG: hypothetical protein JWM20_418 [Patescibacteria group bacterium]|nr:hypothetical protein [Patescibacteria group bacterium]